MLKRTYRCNSNSSHEPRYTNERISPQPTFSQRSLTILQRSGARDQSCMSRACASVLALLYQGRLLQHIDHILLLTIHH